MTGRWLLICTLALAVQACGQGSPAASSIAAPHATEAKPTQPVQGPITVETEMQHVAVHAAEGIVLDIDRLRATMISRAAAAPPVFDDQNSYILQIAHAEISMSMASLQTLMNDYVLAYEGAPLTNVRLSVDEGRIAMAGRLHKGISVPISAKTSVAATADGRMQLRVESMKAIGVPITGLPDLLGLTVEDVMDLKRRGVEVRANDILIAPGQVLPPPEIRGALTRAVLVGDRLVQSFGRAGEEIRAPLAVPAPEALNYVYFGGGTLRFGKLTMTDAELQLIDMDPRDPFDFLPAHYQEQLVAGYSKSTPSGGLKTFMPDFADLRPTRDRSARGQDE